MPNCCLKRLAMSVRTAAVGGSRSTTAFSAWAAVTSACQAASEARGVGPAVGAAAVVAAGAAVVAADVASAGLVDVVGARPLVGSGVGAAAGAEVWHAASRPALVAAMPIASPSSRRLPVVHPQPRSVRGRVAARPTGGHFRVLDPHLRLRPPGATPTWRSDSPGLGIPGGHARTGPAVPGPPAGSPVHHGDGVGLRHPPAPTGRVALGRGWRVLWLPDHRPGGATDLPGHRVLHAAIRLLPDPRAVHPGPLAGRVPGQHLPAVRVEQLPDRHGHRAAGGADLLTGGVCRRPQQAALGRSGRPAGLAALGTPGILLSLGLLWLF